MDKRTMRCKAQYEGKHYFTKDGKKEFVITNFNSAADVTVEFVESGYIKHTNMGNINMGLPNPFANSCICFDTIEHELVGNTYKTNQGYLIKIISVESKQHVYYQFLDEFGYIGCTTIQNIRKGQIRNPYHVNEFGGYLGETPYLGNEYSNIYNIWHSILVRGTGARSKYVSEGYYHEYQQYSNTAVCNEWMCYANFAKWYITELSKLNPKYKYDVDKDLLFYIYGKRTNGMKLYSPVTCVLVPHDLNLYFTNFEMNGPNKENIRESIISMTEKYFKDNAISNNTYNIIQNRYYNNGTKVIYNSRPDDNKYYNNYYTLNNK